MAVTVYVAVRQFRIHRLPSSHQSELLTCLVDLAIQHYVCLVHRPNHGDLIRFYNAVFLPRVKSLVRSLGFTVLESLSANGNNVGQELDCQLSPIPDCLPPQPSLGTRAGMARRLHANHNIYLSPCKPGSAGLQIATALTESTTGNTGSTSPRRLCYNIQNSPAKELKEINSVIQTAEERALASQAAAAARAAKRLYVHGLAGDGAGGPTAAKRLTFQQGQLATARRYYLDS